MNEVLSREIYDAVEAWEKATKYAELCGHGTRSACQKNSLYEAQKAAQDEWAAWRTVEQRLFRAKLLIQKAKDGVPK
jgi:hypothetical protein